MIGHIQSTKAADTAEGSDVVPPLRQIPELTQLTNLPTNLGMEDCSLCGATKSPTDPLDIR
jgi:hypothetical protein